MDVWLILRIIKKVVWLNIKSQVNIFHKLIHNVVQISRE